MNIRLSVVFLSICLLCGISCDRRKSPEIPPASSRAVRVFTVEAAPEVNERLYPGRLKAGDKVVLSFQVDGKIEKVNVAGGQSVKRGTVLARLDSVIYQKRLEAARATYEEARQSWERNQNLARKKIVSGAELEKSRRIYDVARAEYEKAEEDLAYTEITAPFDGIITNIYVDTHQRVNARQNIMLLQNVGTMLLDVDIPERDVAGSTKTITESNRKYADRMFAYFPGNPAERFPLKIKEYTAEADPVTQTFTVTFFLENSKNYWLLPGVTMLVSLPEVRSGPNGGALFRLPVESVFHRSDGTFVWGVSADSTLSAVPVEVRSVRGKSAYVSGPLRGGMRIVASGGEFLSSGERVHVFEADGAGGGGLR